jgi:methyl-accepting chemotaxis protein
MNDVTTDRTSAELAAVYKALDRVQAIIEFELDGTVIAANENFLELFGYAADEVVGHHHRMFCDQAYAESPEYQALWKKLAEGAFIADEFRRVSKDGQGIWLRASYNPVIGKDGKPVKVIKFATDITSTKMQAAEYRGLIAAINRAQAAIEFGLDGTILDANENFLTIFGYTKDEIVGKHHSIFCEPGYADSHDYKAFWRHLGQGEFNCGEFRRLRKDGTEVWLQATYNPIMDLDGKPVKVVKFATDITAEVQKRSLAMLEMSTPVTKIWDGVLFAPIVGIVDSKRAIDIMDKALASILDHRAHTLMLDIGGVGVVDTAVADHLIKIAKAAVLMGCKTTISGISPAIAQTIAELGIDLGAIQTTSTIETGLREAIASAGRGRA